MAQAMRTTYLTAGELEPGDYVVLGHCLPPMEVRGVNHQYFGDYPVRIELHFGNGATCKGRLHLTKNQKIEIWSKEA